MESGRYISAPLEVRMAVMKELGLSQQAMSFALRYQRIEGKSAKAREMVLQHKEACIYRYFPESEAIHDVDGKMRQYFANEVVLIADKATSSVELWRKNELLAAYHNVTLAMLDGIQRYAEGL